MNPAITALLDHPEVRPLLPGIVARGRLEAEPGAYASFCEVLSQAGLEEWPGGVPAIVEALRVAAEAAAPSTCHETPGGEFHVNECAFWTSGGCDRKKRGG